ncbi:conserved protein, unknown function [Hepatocystis sp. ex Piliocolobus tephrosceles]|nr:conserved protein, unknown function [Hepatocystis sp. ex Piliocolobus tephrosceles]
MGRSSKSRSGGFGSRSSALKPMSSSGMSRGNNSSSLNRAGGNMMQPSQKSGGFLSNMMGTVASGMASGVGFGVAQRAVDAVMGPRHVEVSHQNNNEQLNQNGAMSTERNNDFKCQSIKNELSQCLMNHSDISLCQNYADSLKSCQQYM